MIVGLTGFKGSGKGEVAKYLSEEYGFIELSFAGILKKAMNITFDWPEHYGTDPKLKEIVDPRWGISPRQAYQLYGTEVLRESFPSAFPAFQATVGSDFWIKRLFASLDPNEDYSISDVRFQNEVDAINNKGGVVYKVSRLSCVPTKVEHASEDIERLEGIAGVIHNNMGLDAIAFAVDMALAPHPGSML